MKPIKLLRLLGLASTLLSALEGAKELLELLAKDDYDGAAKLLLENPALQDDLQRLPAEVVGIAPLLLPLFLKALDRYLPEEQILKALG